MNKHWVPLAGLLLIASACTSPEVPAGESAAPSSFSPPPVGVSTTPTPGWDEVFRQIGPGVVRISALSCDDGGWSGSAFVISDNVVVTAAHVAAGARTLSVQTSDGVTVAAEAVGVVPESDVAVLRLAESLDVQPLLLAESVPERGAELAVLGYPLGTFDLRIVNGIVVGLPEPVDYPDQHVERAFITNASTNGGNSGGPVVDRTGHVIGVLSGGQNWDDNEQPVEGVNFVVPIEDVRSVIDDWRNEIAPPTQACDNEQLETPGDDEPSDDSLDLSVQDESDLANAIAQVLYTHGVAINNGAYDAAFELFTPAAQQNLGGLAEWTGGVEASYWRGIDVMDASISEDESLATARVALRTVQPPSGEVTDCSIWILDYQFSIDEGQLLIDKARGSRPTPC